MNRGVLQSSPVQQMMAGNPNWWIINNNMRPPLSTSSTLHHQQQQILSPNYLPSSTNHLSPYSPFICTPPPPPPPSSCNSSSSPSSFSSNWHQEHQDQHHFPAESWSQLLLGGLVGCEDKGNNNNNMGIFQGRKMKDWEEQVLDHHKPQVIDVDDHVKQENSSSYVYEHATNDHHDHHLQDFQQAKPTTTTTNWPPHQMMPITSSPNSSSLTSFSNNSSTNMLEFSTIKGDTTGRHPPPDRSSECNSSGTGGGAVKKARVQASSTTGQTSFKVRKEKLGDRITALHQLVSPFGKTDTASVLLEAIGYIRFLQSQIEALSLPYLGSGSPNMGQQKSDSFEEPKKDLKSRGLCLVPVSCTLQVGSDNGADYWAPAIGGGFQ